MKLTLTLMGTLAVSSLAMASAIAQERGYYISGSIGGSYLDDSENRGAFTEDFTVSGTGTDLDGAVLPAGTDVGWNTEFDDALTYAIAVGKQKGDFRFEAELAFSESEVDTHGGVEAGGIALDGVDAAVLIESQDTPLGATVGTIVADGQGELSTTYLFLNGYYDITLEGSPISPYVGAGIGAGFVDVDYSPSGVDIVNDDDTRFAYQVMVGASYAASERTDIFAELGYRGTTDVEVETNLFPGQLDIENHGLIGEIGVRYRF